LVDLLDSGNQHAGMNRRRIYDEEGHAFFITFSCYHRRRLLDHPAVRDGFVRLLAETLARHQGVCSGFVVMPDHVHLIVGFNESNRLSAFMRVLKQNTSQQLKRVLRGVAPEYAGTFPLTDPFWQAKYYPFNLFTEAKMREKLDYMHMNPVTAGLVERAVDWRLSSARYYLLGEASIVPLSWGA
jgi:putative transposase